MQLELKRIQREVGITFVYVTHDQSEALTMSDRIAVMNKGRIEQLGTPAQIYETPATRFVAGFIGTSNILTGTAQQAADNLVRIDYGGDQHVLAHTSHSLTDTEIVITVRPEKIRLGTEMPDANMSRIRGTVCEVVYLGAVTHYSVRTVDNTDIVVFQQNSSDASNLAERGDTVWLSWRPEHSYVLPG